MAFAIRSKAASDLTRNFDFNLRRTGKAFNDPIEKIYVSYTRARS